MPSKKQRRRRAKELRHDYEYVYVDEEGQEVDPGDVEVDAGRAARAEKNGTAAKTTTKPRQKARPQSSVRTVPPPSWQRVLKRTTIFAPFMFLGILLLSRGKLTTIGVLVQTLWLVLLFVPFSYMIDRMMYRRYVRQTDEPAPARRQRRA